MKTCVKCGSEFDGRYCIECNRRRAREWGRNNKELAKQRSSQWVKDNPEKAAEYWKGYYAKTKHLKVASSIEYRNSHKQEKSEYDKRYRESNRNKKRVNNQAYRIRARNSGKLSSGIIEKLMNLQHGKCACCGELLYDDFHVDHIIPLSLGGTNTDDNIQLLKSTCNLKKRNMHPIDFMQSKGMLL